MATRGIIALCHEAPARQGDLAHSLCQVALVEGKAPEWIELVPAGPQISAVDGRKFRNTKPERVVERFNADPNDLPIDWEHATEIKGPRGDEAPAAGWITDLQVREGAIWGRVEWTPRGVVSLTNREYRYLSPAFMHDKDGEVIELTSAGLTNRPALRLAELAHKNPQGDIMDPEILKALGLDEKATKEQILAAIAASKKATTDAEAKAAQVTGELATARAEVERAKVPDLTKFVPRADYDAALARATTAEKRIADEAASRQKAEVDAEIEAALKAGKITPATKEYHLAQCSREGGLAAFREFVKAAPVIAPDQVVDPKKVDPKGAGEPSAETLAIAMRCGVTPEMLKKVQPAQ